MRASILFLLLVSSCSAVWAQSDVAAHAPKLLLTPQRLRRLQRDRQRQTVRWVNFANRIESAPDSRERGFELALDYAITRDANVGRQAVEWALGHRCELRQVALVLDWVGDQVLDSERKQLVNGSCAQTGEAQAARDAFFMQIATGEDREELVEKTAKPLITGLQKYDWRDGASLYAAFEFLYAARSADHVELRQEAPKFFLALPAALLLSLKPDQVQHPDWRVHVAALALVALDTNLEASQYLQGWAIEDGQMIREGDGVAYELLWADPYLPGVGYENLDPWSYDPQGNLFARTDWEASACWIHVSQAGVEEDNCPSGWQQKNMSFGRLTLLPFSGNCLQLPKRKLDDSVILWKFKPGQALYFTLNGTESSENADPIGMWKPASNVEGRVCTSPVTLKVPQAHKAAK